MKKHLIASIELAADVSDAICIASLPDTVEFINLSFRHLFQYNSLEEFINNGGMACLEVNKTDLQNAFENVLKKCKWETITTVITKSGSKFTARLKATPLIDETEQVIGVAFFATKLIIDNHSEEYLHLLESFVENANDAVMITEAEPIDEPGPRIVYVNPVFTQITGYSKEEMIGRSPRILQGPNTNRKELDKIREALQTKSPVKVELLNYRKSKEEFWFHFSLVPITDENGRVTHFVSIQRETTFRKKIEEALITSQLQLQKALQANKEILDHSQDIICTIDQEGKFVHINQACEKIWGYTTEEITGQPFLQFVHLEDRKKTLDCVAALMSGKDFRDFENRYIHKDGSVIPMMWAGSWSDTNKLIYSVARDISERKVAEQQIMQSEQLYRSLSQNFPNGYITICDKDYKVVVMEGKELALHNLTSEMVRGKSVYEFFDAQTSDYIIAKTLPAFDGNSLSFELKVSEDLYYICETVPLTNPEGITRIMIVMQNISERKKAEQKLEESYLAQKRSATMLSAIINTLPAQVALVNTKGIIISVNEAWKIFAEQNNLAHPDYGIGHNYIHVCETATGDFAEDAILVSKGIREVISGQRLSFSMEYPCDSPTERRWFNLIVTPVNEEYPTDVVVMHVDITERMQAEQKLQESEQRYKSLFDYHPDAVCSLDLQGNFLSANESLARMADISLAELLASSFMSLVAPEEVDKMIPYYEKACQGFPQHHELNIINAKGRHLYVNVITIPIVVRSEVKGVYSIIKDISFAKKAQALIEEYAERLDNILESITDGFFALDKKYNITYWNKEAERILGVRREEVLEKNLWQMLPQFVEMKYYNIFKKALEENIPVHFQQYHLSSLMWTEVSAYPSQEGLSVYFRDITERKKAEEDLQTYTVQLEKINSELDQFVYRASHDLRSPLLSILGLISLAQSETDKTQIDEYLGFMSKSVYKLDKFIQDIIYYSKNSRTDLIISVIDFKVLIEDMVADLKYMEEAKSISFQINTGEIQEFYTDENRLKVVLNNIIANAIRYHNPRQSNQYIDIQVLCTVDSGIQIRIADNGQGIAKEHQPRIFEMFFRATQQNTGSGLGLYIVKENLKKLKGAIEVDSEPGIGTTFTLYIPNLQA